MFSWSAGNIRYSGLIDEHKPPHGYGEGQLTNRTGNDVTKGTFENDVLNGYGSQVQDGVPRYEDEWQNGGIQGQRISLL